MVQLVIETYTELIEESIPLRESGASFMVIRELKTENWTFSHYNWLGPEPDQNTDQEIRQVRISFHSALQSKTTLIYLVS